MKMNFDTVREIALALPGVEQSTIRGAPLVEVCGRLLACPALHKSAEPNSLVVRVGAEQRAVLLQRPPNIYYVTDHYFYYPSVFARLERNRPKDLARVAGDGLAICYFESESSERKQTRWACHMNSLNQPLAG